MSDFLSRLKAEAIELKEKINKLDDFLQSDKLENLSVGNVLLLQEQLNIMERYHNVLIIRIELIDK